MKDMSSESLNVCVNSRALLASSSQHIIRTRTILDEHFIANAVLVLDTPALAGKLGIDEDAGEGIVGGTHYGIFQPYVVICLE